MPRTLSVVALSLLVANERFVYYGFRVLLVRSGTAPAGFAEEDAFSTYSWFTLAVYGALVPMGLLCDFVIGHKGTAQSDCLNREILPDAMVEVLASRSNDGDLHGRKIRGNPNGVNSSSREESRFAVLFPCALPVLTTR